MAFRALFLFCVSLVPLLTCGEEEWRSFRTPAGQPILARIVEVDVNGVRLLLKEGAREIHVPFDRLSTGDQAYVQTWALQAPVSAKRPAEPGLEQGKPGHPDHPYPYTREELETWIEAIKDRKAPAGLDRQVQKAVNELNLYRLLAGVSWKVLPDEGQADAAERASKTFVEQGERSREADKLREHYLFEEGEEDMEQVVPEFIADSQRQNRHTMPYRTRLLNPKLGRTGFGLYESVVAVRADPPGTLQGPEMWSYPGRGFFPHDRLHGEQWSVYVNYRIPEDPNEQVVVEVTRLTSAPKEAFPLDQAVPGEPMRVRDISVYENAVHFRPAKPVKDGIYWVRVTGQGLEVQYVVHFYE